MPAPVQPETIQAGYQHAKRHQYQEWRIKQDTQKNIQQVEALAEEPDKVGETNALHFINGQIIVNTKIEQLVVDFLHRRSGSIRV